MCRFPAYLAALALLVTAPGCFGISQSVGGGSASTDAGAHPRASPTGNGNALVVDPGPGQTPNSVLPPSPPVDIGGRLSLVDGVLVDPNGAPFSIHGINWFGFETGETMVDGFSQAGTDPLGGDFATVVQRMRLLGFNTVRLPISFQRLTAAPQMVSSACTIPTSAEIAASVTPPGQSPPVTIPALAYPAERTPGQCNDYVPNTSTVDRLVWVVAFLAHNGFYVVLDDHVLGDNTVLQDKVHWSAAWGTLVQQIVADPISADHLLVDVMNEPQGVGILWAASGANPALADLYIAAMDAITAVSPNQLFLVEGTGQTALAANYGDGFCTDAGVVASKGLSDPTPFFHALRGKPYAHQVLISPHVYGPTVTGSPSAYAGADLFDRLSTSFGYLTTTGYCENGVCERFAVVLGEFGSKFIDSGDIACMAGIASYWNNVAPANDGRHAKLPNWIYWDWNPTSVDTGGLVDNNWDTVLWNKVQLLNQMGLAPTY